jgi:hypothetical protein
MQARKIKTHTDGIWISDLRERDITKKLSQAIIDQNFIPKEIPTINFDIPYIYQRGDQTLHCRLVDSVFLFDPDAWTREKPNVIITDNSPLKDVPGNVISVLPEFWSIWHFEPVYIDRPATNAYNCFMNRARGDRSIAFYELVRRDLLSHGLISYNVTVDELENEFVNAELDRYDIEHKIGKQLVPYNTLNGTLEQCIIDSRVSLILETYISDNHIVFSEKIFRALQLPRPWLLYCSPESIKLLESYGFDVLNDYVDCSYDQIYNHRDRMQTILDQLETFIDRCYNNNDYKRFDQAAAHNQALLKKFAVAWPEKFKNLLEKLKQL